MSLLESRWWRAIYALTILIVLLGLERGPNAYVFLWNCRISLIVMLIGTLLNSTWFLSYVIISQTYLLILWVYSSLSGTLFGQPVFDMFENFLRNRQAALGWFYHIAMPIMATHLLWRKKEFATKAWILSSAMLLAVFSTTYYLLQSGVRVPLGLNCVALCKMGAFTGSMIQLYMFLPFPIFVTNWIIVTLIYLVSAYFIGFGFQRLGWINPSFTKASS